MPAREHRGFADAPHGVGERRDERVADGARAAKRVGAEKGGAAANFRTRIGEGAAECAVKFGAPSGVVSARARLSASSASGMRRNADADRCTPNQACASSTIDP